MHLTVIMCCCKNCSKINRQYWIYGCSGFWLIFALILGVMWSTLSVQILNSLLTLRDGSMIYSNWLKPPIPIYLEIYMFNWTNYNDMHTDKNYRPHFEEKGPYIFLEEHDRVDIEWHNENETVSFNQTRTWYFMPSLSNGSLDDEITNINVVAAAAGYGTRDKNKIIRMAVNFIINKHNSKLFITKTVRQLLFDGYEDSLLKFIKKINSTAFDVPFDNFGWFVDRNGSAEFDGRFNMYTGRNDKKTLAMLTSWNGQSSVSFYKNGCGMLNGTTGELWPLNLEANETISVFVPDICRSIPLIYRDEPEFFAIKSKRWIGDNRVFDNGIIYPDTSCFCTNKLENCPDLNVGVMNLSDCQYGAPAFVSFPHFYLANESYLIGLDGLEPNRDKHEFSIALEPSTGIAMDANGRLQINILIQPLTYIDIFENITELMTPMFWFRQKAEINEELAELLNLAIYLLPSIGIWIAYGLCAIGLFLLVVGIYFSITWGKLQETPFATI